MSVTSIIRRYSPVFFVLLSLSVGFYQLRLKPVLNSAGLWRKIESTGSKNCKIVPELKGCEQIILHQPSGVLYLACSDPWTRGQVMRSIFNSGPDNRSLVDYIASYDPTTNKIRPLTPLGFDSPRGLSLHGMDVVTSSSDPNNLFIYLVNHRAPLVGNRGEVGSDEAIEVFRTRVGEETMTHLHTFEDPVTMISVNDVVGSPDGQSVYFTNDGAQKVVSLMYLMSIIARPEQFTVGYCHKAHSGCQIAVDHLRSINGIAKSPWNDTYYVAYMLRGGIAVLSKQIDNTLVLDDEISSDRGFDNLSVDDDGVLWAVGMPKFGKSLAKVDNPDRLAPSSIHRVSVNTGEGSFTGKKYLVEKVIEDDGTLISGATAVVHDTRRKKLFIHGISSPHLMICDI